jgi:uncharacterized Zn finger protein
VENGLKARSNRGDIGSSWWSRRFLEALESLAIGGRLARGKSYARQGQVISLDVAAGTVSAAVQGSRPAPYSVSITVRPLTDAEWTTVEQALVAQALPCAKLLAGEVPPELETIFVDAGIPLVPTRIGDLEQECSCPDWGVPCKHLAAVFYLLAEAFDDDPFLILRWRGRAREELLSALRALRSGQPSDDPHDDPPAVAPTGAAVAVSGLEWPGDRLTRFWQPPPPLPARPPVLRADADVLLRLLATPSRDLGGADLTDRLRTLYQSVSPPDRDDLATPPRPRR